MSRNASRSCTESSSATVRVLSAPALLAATPTPLQSAAITAQPVARSVAGTKHGLLRTTNKYNAVEWLYSPPEDAQLSSAPFVRECRKLIFLCLDAGADRDVARVVAGLTPAKSGAKRPQSVVEVA